MITVVGGGLAGSLLCLELAARGQAVRLIDGGSSRATDLSYGLVPASAVSPWQRLQRRHGDLGLGRRWVRWGTGLPRAAWQLNPERFSRAIARRLAELQVERIPQTLLEVPEHQEHGGPLVLACGTGCLALAPSLRSRLAVSWAGVLELEAKAGRAIAGWPRGLARMPAAFARLELERRAPQLEGDSWVVDPALVPWGDRLLAGQISLIRPGSDLGPPPDPLWMEQQLRQGLARRWSALAEAPGRYRQAPVSFCPDGIPLAEQLKPGLWVLAGFSAAFSQLPEAAACLARQLAADSRP